MGLKIALVGDVHIGQGGNSEYYHQETTKCMDWVIEECKKRKVTQLALLGDLNDSRISINTLSLNYTIDLVLNKFNYFDDIHLIVGNHDSYYKSCNSVNALKPFYNRGGIHIYDGLEEVKIGNSSILMVPWIDKCNKDKLAEFIGDKTYDYCFGHMEIQSFETHKNHFYTQGILPNYLSKRFKWIYSGHFHIRAERGNITYVGNPFQMDWNDYANDKGFYIVDLDTGEREFIQNDVSPTYQKYTVEWVLEYAKDKENLKVKDNWIKLIIDMRNVSDKDIKKAYKILMKKEPKEVKREVIYGDENNAEITVDTTEMRTPMKLINKYIDTIDFESNQKLRIVNIFQDMYDKIKGQ